jgi:valyl-tRNA synthetase
MTQRPDGPTTHDIPSRYDPEALETAAYARWEAAGYFGAAVEPGRPKFCVTIPPPNVTGELHMGHGLQHTIHDTLIRWKRMQGFNTLCLPGTDHASISTQMKVVQALAAEGVDRRELGREAFIARCWEWTEKYGGTILRQLRRLGCSYDWSRTRFTLDPAYERAVLTCFVQWYDRGWIYRAPRIVNWCPTCQTNVSDLEIDHRDVESHLWHIHYPIEDCGTRIADLPDPAAGSESGMAEHGSHDARQERSDNPQSIVVATTRPETMLGDTGVAVHPEDARYRNLVGRSVMLPLMERPIPIVADAHVAPAFGTGAVKVTPAHDPNDYEIAQRTGLPSLTVIAKDGTMTAEAGAYAGMDRLAARKAVVAALEERGLLGAVTEYRHSVGHHDRCGTVIEPLISEQWWVNMEELARLTREAIESGRVRFAPERFAQYVLDWMAPQNIRDWNISRQLWWGQRIPVWTYPDGTEVASIENPGLRNGQEPEQDPDVLDTWFSSALWPFATLGWPERTPDLEYFYPTDLMITGRDILNLWIARMIMTSECFLGREPFPVVMVHATVMDAEGKRMSKTLGTGVDPLELADKYGADATRFGLAIMAGETQDIRFAVERDKQTKELVRAERAEMARNFCTKIWNASRFVLMNLGETPPAPMTESALVSQGKLLVDRWIWSRFAAAVDAVTRGLESYRLDEASRALYSFFWDEFCDVYVELAKPRLRGSAEEAATVRAHLVTLLDRSLRLAHPFLPHLTDEIWRRLPGTGESVMVAAYPAALPELRDEAVDAEVSSALDIVRAIRNARAQLGLPPRQSLAAHVSGGPERHEARGIIENVAAVSLSNQPLTGATVPLAAGGAQVSLAAGDLGDLDEKRARAERELMALRKDLERVQAKLANPSFAERAPAAVVEKERRILAELQEKRSALEKRLAAFGASR